MVRRGRPSNSGQEEISAFQLPQNNSLSNQDKSIKCETDSNNNSIIISQHRRVSLPSGKDSSNNSRPKQWSYIPSYVRVLGDQKQDCNPESSTKVTAKRAPIRRNTVTFGRTTKFEKLNSGYKPNGSLIQLREKYRRYTEPEICVKEAVAAMEARIAPSNNESPKPTKPLIRPKPAALLKPQPKPVVKPKAPPNGLTRNAKFRRSLSDPNLEKTFNQVKKIWDQKVESEKRVSVTDNDSSRTDSVSSLSSIESNHNSDRKAFFNQSGDCLSKESRTPAIAVDSSLMKSKEQLPKKEPILPPQSSSRRSPRSRAGTLTQLQTDAATNTSTWPTATSPPVRSSTNENLSVSEKAMLFGGAKKSPLAPPVESRRSAGSRSPAFQRYRRSLSDDALNPSSDSEKGSADDAHLYDEVPYTRQRNDSEITNAKKFTDRRNEDEKRIDSSLQRNAFLAKERRSKENINGESPSIRTDAVEAKRGGFLNEVRRRSEKEKSNSFPKEVSSTAANSAQAVKKTEETIFGQSSSQVDLSRRLAEEAEFKGRRRASSLHKLMDQQYNPSSNTLRSMTPGNSPILNRSRETEHNECDSAGALRPISLPLRGRERASTEGSNKRKQSRNEDTKATSEENFAKNVSINTLNSGSPITPDKHSSGFIESASISTFNSDTPRAATPELPPRENKPTLHHLPKSVLEKRRVSETMSAASVESNNSQSASIHSLSQDFNALEVYDKIAKQMSDDDIPETPMSYPRPSSGDCSSGSMDSGFRNSLEVPSNRSSRRGAYSAGDFWSDFEEDDEMESAPSSPCKVQQDTPRMPSPSLSVKETTEVKLHNIAKELLSTEESYVKVLHLIDKVFHKQVRDAAVQKHIMPEAVVNNIFCHVPAIYQFHSSYLLPQLQERLQNWETNPRIGDIMTQAAPFLKMYSLYVQHFDEAMNTIKQWSEKSSGFSAIIKAIQKTPECNSLTLQHHMLGPVQRVPRYRLLLTDYLKRLPEDAEDRQEAETALELISKAATHSNETMKKIEKFHQLVNIFNSLADVNFDIVDVTRELLKEGKIIKISARNGEKHERYLYLFSDMLLCCAPLRRLQGKAYRVTAKIDLDGMKIAALKHTTVSHTFGVNGLQKSMEFAANSQEEKEEWVQAVQEAILEREERLRTFRSFTGEPSESHLSPVNGQAHGSPLHPTTPSHQPFVEIADADLGTRAPKWIKDHEVTMCMSCQKPFNKILRRRHHCRACGKVVCSECSEHKAPLNYDSGKHLRVCDRCYNILTGRHQNESADGERKGVLEVEADAVSENSVIADYLFVSESEKKKNWTKTWCVIPKNELCLYFYGAHQDVRAQMTMPLPGFEVTNVESSEHKYCFKLKQARKVFVFGSSDRDCTERWKYALGQASKGEDLFRDDVYRLGRPEEPSVSSSEESEGQPGEGIIQETDNIEANNSNFFTEEQSSNRFLPST